MSVKGYIHILCFDCTLTSQLSLLELKGLSQCRLGSEHLEDSVSYPHFISFMNRHISGAYSHGNF